MFLEHLLRFCVNLQLIEKKRSQTDFVLYRYTVCRIILHNKTHGSSCRRLTISTRLLQLLRNCRE